MSVESAKKFVEKMKNDQDYLKKVSELKSGKERLEFARTEGFDFTEAEMKEATSALSDEELDAVAGGAACAKVCKWGVEVSVDI